jgi:hypothetical protein
VKRVKTMGEARREKGIPESDYIRGWGGRTPIGCDDADRISTIRCLVRWFGPPDSRIEHIGSCQLHWYADKRRVVVRANGSITS